MPLVNKDIFAPIYKELKKNLKSDVYLNESMARHTTFKVGGPAAIFVIANSLEELRTLILLAKKNQTPFLIVGRGSNLLVSDKGFEGIVIRLGTYFSKIIIDGSHVQAGASVTLPALVQATCKEGLKSLVFAVGIPGTLGGALALNAGAFGECVGNFVKSVTVYSFDAELKAFDRSQINFDYRSSSLKNKGIILEATLRLEKGDITRIKVQMERYFKARKDSQPLNFANAGSVFKNPPKLLAGKIVEEVGCKGWREGNAKVSEKHANFIVNLGNAQAADIYELIQKVRNKVFEEKGILLEPEISFVGDFESV
jgi:UDP-N-acetylmuramate dehydrogenase